MEGKSEKIGENERKWMPLLNIESLTWCESMRGRSVKEVKKKKFLVKVFYRR